MPVELQGNWRLPNLPSSSAIRLSHLGGFSVIVGRVSIHAQLTIYRPEGAFATEGPQPPCRPEDV
jgi:hypothetical protein